MHTKTIVPPWHFFALAKFAVSPGSSLFTAFSRREKKCRRKLCRLPVVVFLSRSRKSALRWKMNAGRKRVRRRGGGYFFKVAVVHPALYFAKWLCASAFFQKLIERSVRMAQWCPPTSNILLCLSFNVSYETGKYFGKLNCLSVLRMVEIALHPCWFLYFHRDEEWARNQSVGTVTFKHTMPRNGRPAVILGNKLLLSLPLQKFCVIPM